MHELPQDHEVHDPLCSSPQPFPIKAELLNDYLLDFLEVPRSAPAISHVLSPTTISVLVRTDSATTWQGPLLRLVQWVFLAWILKLTLTDCSLCPRSHSALQPADVSTHPSDLPLWSPFSPPYCVLLEGRALPPPDHLSEMSSHRPGTHVSTASEPSC